MKKQVLFNLKKNAYSTFSSAIEIHNKPNIEYRYENVTILLLNAWELILKAFVRKYTRKSIFKANDYTISIDQQVTHLKAVHGAGNLGEKPGRWNQHWAEWINKNPDATQKEIFQRAGEMLRSFNLQNCNIHPYKK